MTTIRYRFYALVPGSEAETCLLHDTLSGTTLPAVEVDDQPWHNVAIVIDAFAARFGLRLTKRQSIAQWRTEEADHTVACDLWTTERHDTAPLPPDLRAVRSTGAQNAVADAPLSDALGRWQANGTTLHDAAEPWARPGWFADAVTWMTARLAENDLRLEGDVRQIKAWPLSCVLQAGTGSGSIFFKAVPPLFGAEPGITAALAARYPAHVPAVLAVDRERGWTLMRDHGARLLYDIASVEAWEAVLRRYAEIQVELSERPDILLAAGCADRRVGALEAQTVALAEACRQLLPTPRDNEMISELVRLAPRLQSAERALQTLGIAPTLVHGDFHANNIGLAGDRVVFFDWTDAALAHPFIDIYVLLEEARWDSALATQMPAVETQLVDAYLAAFRPFVASETLSCALALVAPVAAHFMVRSYVSITRALAPDDRAEMAGALALWLKRLLH